MRNYTTQYRSTNDDGTSSVWTAFSSVNALDDHSDVLAKELQAEHQNDPNYEFVRVVKQPIGDTDYELLDRMRSIRDMCELGHKVRAEVKIRNRQPLKTAYVLFANKQVQDYMVYIDCKNDEYGTILGDELNVDNIVFIADANQFTDINLKPNFRVLGQKGFGKQAQALKAELNKLSMTDRKSLWTKLESKLSVNMAEIDLVFSDLEVEFVPKAGFASASGKHGVIILDTTLTSELKARGFVADFKSMLQNTRKDIGLELTDRVFIEVYCIPEVKDVLEKHSEKLKKELLANHISFLPVEQAGKDARKIVVEGVGMFVNVLREV